MGGKGGDGRIRVVGWSGGKRGMTEKNVLPKFDDLQGGQAGRVSGVDRGGKNPGQ